MRCRHFILAILLILNATSAAQAEGDHGVLMDVRSLLANGFDNVANVQLQCEQGFLSVKATVRSANDKDALIELLNQIENVARVETNITVDPSMQNAGSDYELERQINTRLSELGRNMQTEKLGARVFEGVTVLGGLVTNRSQADALLNAVKTTPGIGPIENYLSVAEPHEISDLKSNVLMAIEASVHPQRAFSVKMVDGRIHICIDNEIDNATYEAMKVAALTVVGVQEVERETLVTN